MIIKAREISVEISIDSIKKLNNWKCNLNHTLASADVVYETDTYEVKAYYCTEFDRIYIYSKDKNSTTTEISNFIGIDEPKKFKAGDYYVLSIRFSEETLIWAQGSSIIFTDYRKCIETLKRIIGLKINVGFGGEDFPI